MSPPLPEIAVNPPSPVRLMDVFDVNTADPLSAVRTKLLLATKDMSVPALMVVLEPDFNAVDPATDVIVISFAAVRTASWPV